ncbi:hypothetical protein FJZ31_16760 [Candidatus Poribacteria bacterium]|nr:hypothetical protein [Candidatus Poribacteria bacterium]
MTRYICLIVLMLLLIATTAGWSNNILFYVLSDRKDSGGWYTGPGDVVSLTDPVKAAGHSVKVEDETTVKDLTSVVLSKYDHIWILEGDEDSTVEVSKDEAEALYQYYQQGAVIWISAEEGAWAEDTKVFMNRFDVDVENGVSGPAGPKIDSDHPLFKDVKTLRYDGGQGGLIVKNPDVSVIWQYPSNAGKKDAIALLDKKGYVVFEAGWVSGYAYRPEAAGDGNIQFALNIAEIKPRLGVMPTDKKLTLTWGKVKKKVIQ